MHAAGISILPLRVFRYTDGLISVTNGDSVGNKCMKLFNLGYF